MEYFDFGDTKFGNPCPVGQLIVKRIRTVLKCVNCQKPLAYAKLSSHTRTQCPQCYNAGYPLDYPEKV